MWVYLKQLVKVLFEKAFHAFAKIIITETEWIWLALVLFSPKLKLVCKRLVNDVWVLQHELHLGLSVEYVTWCLGEGKINSVHSRFSTSEWYVQLSMMNAIFLLTEPNFRLSTVSIPASLRHCTKNEVFH